MKTMMFVKMMAMVATMFSAACAAEGGLDLSDLTDGSVPSISEPVAADAGMCQSRCNGGEVRLPTGYILNGYCTYVGGPAIDFCGSLGCNAEETACNEDSSQQPPLDSGTESVDATDPFRCEQGSQQGCFCTDGTTGIQSCQGDGTWSPCDCTVKDGGVADADVDAALDGGILLDATQADAAEDGGVIVDSGVADTGVGMDASLADTGVQMDSGNIADSGADAGLDAGGTDAGACTGCSATTCVDMRHLSRETGCAGSCQTMIIDCFASGQFCANVNGQDTCTGSSNACLVNGVADATGTTPCGAGCNDINTGNIRCLWVPDDFGISTPNYCSQDNDRDGISPLQGDCLDFNPLIGFCNGTSPTPLFCHDSNIQMYQNVNGQLVQFVPRSRMDGGVSVVDAGTLAVDASASPDAAALDASNPDAANVIVNPDASVVNLDATAPDALPLDAAQAVDSGVVPDAGVSIDAVVADATLVVDAMQPDATEDGGTGSLDAGTLDALVDTSSDAGATDASINADATALDALLLDATEVADSGTTPDAGDFVDTASDAGSDGGTTNGSVTDGGLVDGGAPLSTCTVFGTPGPCGAGCYSMLGIACHASPASYGATAPGHCLVDFDGDGMTAAEGDDNGTDPNITWPWGTYPGVCEGRYTVILVP